MFNKRINIFTGHFGSGKTEVAVNYALQLSKIYTNTAIVDFYIVNPYFRTADVRQELEQNGLRVITPIYANTNVDVPALPAEISSLFDSKEYYVVFDVGGDDVGAKAISRYREEIFEDDYEIFFVINTKRPMTGTPEKIEAIIHEVEDSSRLKVTGLVNNTNLLENTTLEDMIEGHRLIEQVSKKLDIPIAFASGLSNVISKLKGKTDMELLPMKKLIKLPWE
jgi:hypothetical protein